MLQQNIQQAREEDGFTLVELLVVILIIGILAAIAIPTFLGQRQKGQDSSAKSDARNLVSQVESCFANTENYTNCTTATALGDPTGLPFEATASGAASPAEGKVTVTASDATSYVVVAKSKAKTGTTNHTFTITKASGAAATRTCDTGSTSDNDGGCNSGTW